jgi:hypothetical protein
MLLPTPTASQDYKPIRPLAPSEANGTHGKMLVGVIGQQQLAQLKAKRIGNERLYLNPQFVQWMMGYPEGWIEPPEDCTKNN